MLLLLLLFLLLFINVIVLFAYSGIPVYKLFYKVNANIYWDNLGLYFFFVNVIVYSHDKDS